MYQRIHLFS